MSFGNRLEAFDRIELTEHERKLRLVELGEKFEISSATAALARRRGYFYKRRGATGPDSHHLKALELHYRILVLDGETAWHWRRLKEMIDGQIEPEEIFRARLSPIEPWIRRRHAEIIEIAQRRALAQREAQNKKILDTVFWTEE